MRGKTVVITGATSGIGLETARSLAGMGAHVVMVARSRERADAAISAIRTTAPDAALELVLADLDRQAEVRRAAAELRSRLARIDVLINNAGMIYGARELTEDRVERTFAINHLAPFLLTYELRDLLAASAPARVVTVASGAHRFVRSVDWDQLATQEKWPGGVAVYNLSKLCNIWFAREAARRLKGVTSNSLHPGAVRTQWGDTASGLFKTALRLARPFLLTPQQGAQTSIYLASAPEVEDVTGEYFIKCKRVPPTPLGRDDASARRLWELSEALCGVRWS